jgi:hypothetical protein
VEGRVRKALVAVWILSLSWPAWGQSPSAFGDFFADKAMRLDLYQVGDAKDEFITLDHVYQEDAWPESRSGLLDPFGYGRYAVKVYDVASNRLIYSRGFDGMFGEYKTTTPALNGVKRVFERTVRIPWPKRTVLFVVEMRDRQNLLRPLFTHVIDPDAYHIIKEASSAGDLVYEALKSGPPDQKVDLVFVAEGYTAADGDKFKADVDRFAGLLFAVEPYKSMKDSFNVRGILRPSPEPAMDEPRQGVFRKTTLGASFNAFDTDRYMLIEQNHRLREIAAGVPYDTIVVLVNSKRYGGGGIYGDYCVTTVDNPRSAQVFVHEFGHSFAGLADEYYASDVAYNDFYPKGVEPLEPNITALLNPADVKWKGLLSPGIAIPTEYGKDKIEALQAERQKTRQSLTKEIDDAKKSKADEAALKALEQKLREADKATAAKIDEIRKQYADLNDKVGVFEGAGYASKGLYRPMVYCLMISNPKNEFCLVCQQAIARMIRHSSGGTQQ